MAFRVDILLRREAVAKAFGSDDAIKAFEQQQELLAGHPDEIALAQATANTANTTANSADGKANAIKAAPIVTMSATGALTSETVLDAGVIAGFIGPIQLVAAPALSTDPGAAGQIAYDATHFYVCIATDTWVRASLGTF